MPRFARGGLMPPFSERISEESERYFHKFRQSRANVPSPYSSLEKGLAVQLEMKSSVVLAWLLLL